VRVAHGRGNPGDALQASGRELWPLILPIEGPIGPQRGGAGGRVPRRQVGPDDWAARWRLTAMAAQRFHAPGTPGLRLDQQGSHHVMEVGPRIPTLAARAGHDRCVGGMLAVVAALAMQTGAIERRNARGKAPPLGRRGRHAPVACGAALRLARLSSPAEGLIIAMLGFDPPGCQESRSRLVLEQPGPQLAWLVHNAEAVEDHRCDGIARGHEARVWMVSGGAVHDLTHAECSEPTRDKAHMV
jgi:hypothetical protein